MGSLQWSTRCAPWRRQSRRRLCDSWQPTGQGFRGSWAQGQLKIPTARRLAAGDSRGFHSSDIVITWEGQLAKAKDACQWRCRPNRAVRLSSPQPRIRSSGDGSFDPPWWQPRTTSLLPQRTATSAHCHLIKPPPQHNATSSNCHLSTLPHHHTATSSHCHLITLASHHTAASAHFSHFSSRLSGATFRPRQSQADRRPYKLVRIGMIPQPKTND